MALDVVVEAACGAAVESLGKAASPTYKREAFDGKARRLGRRVLHLFQWERALEKERNSLAWKLFLVCGVALFFVVTFQKSSERADYYTHCLERAVLFRESSVDLGALALPRVVNGEIDDANMAAFVETAAAVREWCREQYVESLREDDHYYR